MRPTPFTSCRVVRWCRSAPVDAWLVMLAQGWRLPVMPEVVEPTGRSAYEAFSIVLHRYDEPVR